VLASDDSLELVEPFTVTEPLIPHGFDHVMNAIAECARPGQLWLIGAGPFAACFGAVAKRRGAWALDIGSTFDDLAGIKHITRGGHKVKFLNSRMMDV
jgi:hypothetical protein